MTLEKWRPLQRGAHLRIVAASSAVNKEAIQASAKAIEARGFRVSLGAHLFDRWQTDLHLAGTDRDRAMDLMQALTDPSVDAVLMARGGYGAIRVLPYLDEAVLRHRAPKPLMGFSDVTAIHQFLFYCGWPSIHGPNAHSEWVGTTGDLAKALFMGDIGEITARPLERISGDLPEPIVAPWHGGNLAMLASMVGLPWQPDWRGAILYLEEVHEEPYRIDRMLYQLYLSGILQGIRGMVFGEVLFDTPGDGERAVRRIVEDIADKMGIPAWWGLESGHSSPMQSIPFGVPIEITTDGRAFWHRDEEV